jgi:pantothenate kinase type III
LSVSAALFYEKLAQALAKQVRVVHLKEYAACLAYVVAGILKNPAKLGSDAAVKQVILVAHVGQVVINIDFGGKCTVIVGEDIGKNAFKLALAGKRPAQGQYAAADELLAEPRGPVRV